MHTTSYTNNNNIFTIALGSNNSVRKVSVSECVRVCAAEVSIRRFIEYMWCGCKSSSPYTSTGKRACACSSTQYCAAVNIYYTGVIDLPIVYTVLVQYEEYVVPVKKKVFLRASLQISCPSSVKSYLESS